MKWSGADYVALTLPRRGGRDSTGLRASMPVLCSELSALGVTTAVLGFPLFHRALARVPRLTLCILALLLIGCGSKHPPLVQPEREIVTVYQPVEIATPVPVKAKLPPELLAPLPPFPLFVAPNDPNATVALTAEGVKQILDFIAAALAKQAGLKAYDDAK